jgi:bifunctional non-homologous end joining protein LigD
MPTKQKTAVPAALGEYEKKRNFRETPEPGPAAARAHAEPIFVVQEHHATRLHYDFRLEADGVLRSWAVTNEPSLDPAIKRLAIRVEDHPLGYANFEGTIPSGSYGAGEVSIWDRGTFQNLDPTGTIADGIEAGKLSFVLRGAKLQGRFVLVRMRGGKSKRENWLLIKGRDENSRPGDAAKVSPRSQPRASLPRAKPVATAIRQSVPPAPQDVEITHPDKVLYPDEGFTKADVRAYYQKVARWLLPFLKDRPVTLERLPDGLKQGGPHFWQKNTPDSYPDWIARISLETEGGKPVNYPLVNDEATLLYLVNQGTLTFHPWLSRVDDLDRPDFVLFDLDPGKAPFEDVVTVAKAVKAVLDQEAAGAFVKTSGKSGLHILTPWERDGGFDTARAWALNLAERSAQAMPERATVDIRKAKRGGRVYIDVMQNARGHHAVPPYVLRAVPGATVSTPLEWREVTEKLDPGIFTLKRAITRFARQKIGPMAEFVQAIRGRRTAK